MGKRKSSRKVQKAPKPKLEKVFDCPFCNHNKTVEICFKKADQKASISCRVCTVSWETKMTPLMEAIDVYSDWIDACEHVNSN
jgi:transcription elongation factor Elf1